MVAGYGVVRAETFESRGVTFYGFRVEPRGGERLADGGWGLGTEGAWSPARTPSLWLTVGADGGNLGFDDSVTAAGIDPPVVLTASRDFLRLFAGADFWLRAARVRPHGGLHLALVRQDARLLRFDPAFGEFESVESESDTGLGYDASAGLAIQLGRSTRVDAGARYLRAPDLSGTDFLLLYVGVGFGSR